MGSNSLESSSSTQPKPKKTFDNVLAEIIFRKTFHILTTTLLSLLLPLSFLILARLSIARATNLHVSVDSSVLVNLFLNSNSTLLNTMLPLVSIAALTDSLNGKITISKPAPISGPRLYASWALLCALQVCVGLGIEGSIATSVVGGTSFDFRPQKSALTRALFLLGLHETMLFWSRNVVKPVVDDTVFGFVRGEWWVDKAAMAVSFGGLWWWKLREEVEALVVVAEVKRDVSMNVGVADFVGWWLYYLTVTVGVVKVVNTLILLPIVLLYRRVQRDRNTHNVSSLDNNV